MQMDPRVLLQQQQQNPGVGPVIHQGPPGVVPGPLSDGAAAQQGPKQRKGRPSKNAVNKLAVSDLKSLREIGSEKVMNVNLFLG